MVKLMTMVKMVMVVQLDLVCYIGGCDIYAMLM
jgi:hypothetical protein